MGCVQIMNWSISNLGQWPLWNLGSVAYCYVFIIGPPNPLFLPSNVLTGRVSTSWPNTPYTDVCLVYAQDHPPTWESPVYFPEYLCSRPHPYPFLSVLPPSKPPFLLPHLPDSSCLRTLAAAKISSTVTFSCLPTSACLYHGTRIFPPPSCPVSLAHTSKIGYRYTHSSTVVCLLSK